MGKALFFLPVSLYWGGGDGEGEVTWLQKKMTAALFEQWYDHILASRENQQLSRCCGFLFVCLFVVVFFFFTPVQSAIRGQDIYEFSHFNSSNMPLHPGLLLLLLLFWGFFVCFVLFVFFYSSTVWHQGKVFTNYLLLTPIVCHRTKGQKEIFTKDLKLD